MPCLAKKYECQRDEFKVDGNPDVDYSISTRELASLIKSANIDFLSLPDEDRFPTRTSMLLWASPPERQSSSEPPEE